MSENARYLYLLFIQIRSNTSGQKENKSRVLAHRLFYRNVCLTLIVRKILLAMLSMHNRFIGCLFPHLESNILIGTLSLQW
jgi:hypothetical protein